MTVQSSLPASLAFAVRRMCHIDCGAAPVSGSRTQTRLQQFQSPAMSTVIREGMAACRSTGTETHGCVSAREEPDDLDLKEKVKRIKGWAESDSVAEVAVYDSCGCLCVGRTCVEVWMQVSSAVSFDPHITSAPANAIWTGLPVVASKHKTKLQCVSTRSYAFPQTMLVVR